MKTILIVDDDLHIREVIAFALEQAGYNVKEAGDGNQALAMAAENEPDLVVLDILMPEMDGLAVCRRLRKLSEVPILFLSSKSDEVDRIIGLEIGGDDYVTKPFSPRELVARVGAIFRRTDLSRPVNDDEACSDESYTLRQGRMSLDLESHAACWDEQVVPLTAREFALLATLIRRPKRVFLRDELMDATYDQDVTVSQRTIDSHVRGVRSKFAAKGADSVIETVHGVGYKLGNCE
ncbi:MAG: DNA-binding response regulator [Desulfovibrio sp.]|nr:MAG: DNA-binding response regulator [Desulfovibrio sp.]